MRFLAVDISHVFSMMWEASEGKEFSAAFNRTIDNVTAARVGFDRCMLAVDSGPSFRKRFPEYKANRKDRGEPYREQLKRAIERLTADGCVPVVAPKVGEFANEFPAFAEADDVMGWAVEEYSKIVGPMSEEAASEWQFAILSDDSDMEQLIDDAANVIVVKSSLRGGEHWNEAKVIEKRGVGPDKIADIKALAGDKTDNYDGYTGPPKPRDPARPDVDMGNNPGVGPAHAVSLIKLYGGALEVFDLKVDELAVQWEADGVKPGIRATLARHGRAVAERGMFLATIRRDLDELDFAAVLAPPVVSKIETSPPYFAAPTAIQEASFEPVAEPTEARQSTALAARVVGAQLDVYGLQPRGLPEVEAVAAIVMNSRAYGFANKEQVVMAIVEARERGVPVGAALRAAYNVRGKLAWSASFLAALVLASGKADHFEITETTSQRATLEYKRVGRPGGSFTFTIEEAQRAGWCRAGASGESKWLTNPRTMLRWAALREAARAFFADVVSGMYTPDEIGGDVRPDEFEGQ